MGRFWRGLAVVGSFVAGAGLLLLLVGSVFGFFSVFVPLVLGAAYTWIVFGFLHYRQCRQEELLGVVRAAAAVQAPLPAALWAYLRDRPHDELREFWVGLLLNFVAPGYYWIWYRRFNYDRKVEQVVLLLEAGHSLSQAVELTPGVASRMTQLALALGQKTGRLAPCLEALDSPARSRLSILWIEIVARLAYPLFLVFVIGGILQFWSVYLLPRFQRIFTDLHQTLPEPTERVIALGEMAEEWFWGVIIAMQVVIALLFLLLTNTGFRWYFPIVGHYYREYVRSQILQALSFLLQAQKPAPIALVMLAGSDAFPQAAQWRLEAVRRRVEQGEPLADSLRRGRLLPRAMVPLLRTAERAGNLPWALAELADILAQRAVRRVQRASVVLFPLPVVGLGVLVFVIVLGIYVPLIYLMEGLSQ